MNKNTPFLLVTSAMLVMVGAGCSTPNQEAITQSNDPIVAAPVAPDSVPHMTLPADGEDLEKFIVDQKNAEFKTYSEIAVDLSNGYPVVFSDTDDPAVRFTSFSNSGGDGADVTFYFINQAAWKILKIEASEFGGDFGASGRLRIFLNTRPESVISREQKVDEQKREITFNGLSVNGKIRYSPSKPIILKPKSVQKFTVLGVSTDLSKVYFADSSKNFSYDTVEDTLRELVILPPMAKPLEE